MHLSLEAHLKTQEKMAYFLSISRGLPGRMGLSLGSAGNSLKRKRLYCLWAYFSKYKMKLSSRQPFFFFLIFCKNNLRLFFRSEYTVQSLCPQHLQEEVELKFCSKFCNFMVHLTVQRSLMLAMLVFVLVSESCQPFSLSWRGEQAQGERQGHDRDRVTRVGSVQVSSLNGPVDISA